MSGDQGRPGKDARLVIGAVIVKHKLTLSDEETVLQIQENPYLQYFVGFSSYRDEPPFSPSLFVEIRKRMGAKTFSAFEQTILNSIEEKKKRKKTKLKDTSEPSENHGKMLVDATVAEQAIRYPTDLIDQIERYRQRFGYYPEVVLADNIYGTRANRRYMKKYHIRFGGKPLGRPKKETAENAEQIRQAKLQRRQDAINRIPIEGKFGQGKNGYRLNYIRAKTLRTSEAWINSIFLVMNLMVLLRICCVQLAVGLKRALLKVKISRLTGIVTSFV